MDNLELIKEEFKRNLPAGKDKFDARFDTVGKGFSPLVLVVLAILALVTLQVGIGVLIGLVVFYDLLAVKLTYNDRRSDALAHVAADVIQSEFCVSVLNSLEEELHNIPLSSLKSVSCSLFYTVVFRNLGNKVFSYYFRNGTFYKSYNRSINSADLHEISPGVFIQYDSLWASLKCDFRIVREPMSQMEVAAVFKKIVAYFPYLSIDNITVKQYSSTKNFKFKKDYLDSGTISYFYSKSRPKSLSLGSESQSHSYSGSQKKNDVSHLNQSKNRSQEIIYRQNVKSEATALNPVLKSEGISILRLQDLPTYKKRNLLLSDIQDRRKEVETYAMEVVMGYEQFKKRKPADVSSSNAGYDILSTVTSHSVRYIEVKGLSGHGDVILTANELQSMESLKDSYYVYVVDNCLTPDKQQLYILPGVKKSELFEEIVDYKIDYTEQEKAAKTCHL